MGFINIKTYEQDNTKSYKLRGSKTSSRHARGLPSAAGTGHNAAHLGRATGNTYGRNDDAETQLICCSNI